MSSIFQKILGWLLVYRYVTLFLITFFSSLGVPVPAGSIVMASAAFASQGYFSVVAVLIISTLGNILGDISMYTLSKKYGKKILYWLRLKKLTESGPLLQAENATNNYSPFVIIVSRFQDQATTVVNILAGLGNINFKKFIFYIITGDLLQTIFYSSIGYFFAESWQALYKVVGVFSWIIVLVTLLITMIISSKLYKRMVK